MDSAAAKARRARRILSLCRHVQQVESGRYARLEALLGDAQADAVRVALYLDNPDSVMTSLWSMVLGKAHNQLLRCDELEEALKIQARKSSDEARRVKLAERLVAQTQDSLAQERTYQELREIVDYCLRANKVSAP
jgi:hypothetical protein